MDLLFRVVLLVTLASSLSSSIVAQFSPGPLSKAHRRLEGLDHCTDCHTLGKGVSDSLCLDCHKPIQTSQASGFHSTVSDTSCTACHSDHHGLAFELIRWPAGDLNAFDHERSGYSLTGAHSKTECRTCHVESLVVEAEIRLADSVNLDRTFLGLATDCVACHTDVHGERLEDTCESCHTTEAWKPTEGFDHDVHYVLDGAHKPLTCDQCHAKDADDALERTFPELSTTCASCHETPHNPAIPETCETCHTTTAWHGHKPDDFDHDRTRFGLLGKHRSTSCESCHHERLEAAIRPPTECSGCHEDAHQGQFRVMGEPVPCETCHDESSFHLTLFGLTEHRETRYPLEGAHTAVPCVMCHDRSVRGPALQFRWQEPELYCATCHTSPHRDAYAERDTPNGCERCHAVEDWSAFSFDHDRTEFALTGLHHKVTCKQCHETGLVALGEPGAKECATCHEDPHVGQFARMGETNCERCHESVGWKRVTFNHQRDSQFSLEGAHENVACQACHPVTDMGGGSVVRYRPIEPTCETCHS